MSTRTLRRTTAALACLALATGLAGCSGDDGGGDPDRLVVTPVTDGSTSGLSPRGDGTRASVAGYTIEDVRLPGADRTGEVSFRIVDEAGKALTDYTPEQTKLLHLYVVRDDLGEFRHVHPELGEDGTWRGRVDLGGGGWWRVVTEFIPQGADRPVVLGTSQRVPGKWQPAVVPTGDAAATSDDGVVRIGLDGHGEVGSNGRLRIAVTTPHGEPLQLGSYLGATAHLTGFAIGTGGFVHVHPLGAPEVTDDGTILTFHTTFTEPGSYRMFVQVRVDGLLHQVAVTATVDPEA
ncbi:hypothetical protein CFH99_18030 [Nocardioides aromaticivorans]|uniref:Secreted protein n=1 Tax=Nocardioides aromaticivorans TaxID=200618 RepID=A0ABX7PNG2_9ACTN|nr:hypothetical protein [Nocardioides aromaticivorans]QSR27524.1 hypothetical protein CFH99_18030 [Nocardioides aromaticivorans]